MYNEFELCEMAFDDFYEACLNTFKFIVGEKRIYKFKGYVQSKSIGKRLFLKLLISCLGALFYCAVLVAAVLIYVLIYE